MQLTNYDRWRLYTDALISPDSYIDFGFYYLIAACLQRRVWIGPSHSPLYPNLYVILVGEPGIGKGLVIKQIAKLLTFHKLRNPRDETTAPKTGEKSVDAATIEAIAEADYRLAMANEGALDSGRNPKNKSFDKPLLFPIAADATTYEALVKAMANSLRRINYDRYDERLKRNTLAIYTHSSLCFCLEEIASLFRNSKKTEDVVNFLIQTYDCGDYTYDTKTQGKDRIKSCCLNLFGGTTPGFMQETFDDRLITEGFASRCFFIFSTKNRKVSLWMPDLTPEQIQAYTGLQEHIQKLSGLYGRVALDIDTMNWLDEWWKACQDKRANTSPKLNPYYARKNIHVLKLAMAIHFAESLEMSIPRICFERAIHMLDEAEKGMHLAIGVDKDNPLAKVAKRILKFMADNGKVTRKQLAGEFWESLPKGYQDLDGILEHLLAQNQIEQDEQPHPLTKVNMVFYFITRQKL